MSRTSFSTNKNQELNIVFFCHFVLSPLALLLKIWKNGKNILKGSTVTFQTPQSYRKNMAVKYLNKTP